MELSRHHSLLDRWRLFENVLCRQDDRRSMVDEAFYFLVIWRESMRGRLRTRFRTRSLGEGGDC